MKRKFSKVYQFKVTLKGIKPPIWRRIQVPEVYTFWDLHVAIQDAMGWLDYHLHEFTILNPSTGRKDEIGIPEDEPLMLWDKKVHAGWRCKIADYFSLENSRANYVYDFGDNWQHTIKLEKILPRDKDFEYPICIRGKREGPPEDCGGVWGYQELLEIIMDPTHEDHESTLDWIGDDFDPEYFDPAEVIFDDPQERWNIAFEEE